jgi:hypothetical protein
MHALLIIVVLSLAACGPARTFNQSECKGPQWYREPVTMRHALTCARGR